MAAYRIEGWPGIAFTIVRKARRKGFVVVRMVGDDRDFEERRDDLTRLKKSEFCPGCGQIGCGCA